jgi:Putative Ig domain
MRSTLMAALLALALVPALALAQEQGAPLEFATQSTLPKAVLSVDYETKLVAKGGVPPHSWAIIDGSLPPGMALNPATGVVSGAPTAPGVYHFVVEVSDSDDPPDTRTREFSIAVISALTVEWKSQPAVSAGGISGSVKLTNHTADDLDLTMIVVAVNEIDKAFVLGYQHFTFAAQSDVPEITFGSSLPNGSYIVHVDVIAEVPDKNVIHRARLQTSEPLAIQ